MARYHGERHAVGPAGAHPRRPMPSWRRQLQFPYAAQTTATPAFTLIQTADGGQNRAMHIASTRPTPAASAIIGEMLDQTIGNGNGVVGISRAANGFGVIGTNLSPIGNCTGVYGARREPVRTRRRSA